MKSRTVEAIYSSKMYKSSSRRDRINAAIASPANGGLIQQVADALDEEYQHLAQYTEEPQEGLSDDLAADVGDDFDAERDTVSVADFGGGGGGSHSSMGSLPPKPDFEAREAEDSGSDSEAGGEPEGPKPEGESDDSAEPELDLDAPIEEATKITSCDDIETSVLKGSLNSREDTAGVNRILTKESELWIYYNDDINLNNIMTDVIEYLNASGQTYLEFNRLARSDNAMVFIINSAPEQIQPEEQEEK